MDGDGVMRRGNIYHRLDKWISVTLSFVLSRRMQLPGRLLAWPWTRTPLHPYRLGTERRVRQTVTLTHGEKEMIKSEQTGKETRKSKIRYITSWRRALERQGVGGKGGGTTTPLMGKYRLLEDSLNRADVKARHPFSFQIFIVINTITALRWWMLRADRWEFVFYHVLSIPRAVYISDQIIST